MIEFILAIAAMNALRTEPPLFVAAVTTHEACMAEALKRNQNDERLRLPEMREIGAEYVCLKIVRAGV